MYIFQCLYTYMYISPAVNPPEGIAASIESR